MRRYLSSRLVGSSLLISCLAAACATAPAGAPPSSAPLQPAAAAASATPAAQPDDELDRPLPVDARIKVGKLSNGLTYFILPHKKPEKRAQLWLAINTGSVQESDDQRGLAHFVEHMGFNGTRRFPKQALVDFLERTGAKFGPDLNAYTSFDETVYMLQIPTDKPELVDKAMSVLRDWAGDMSFDAAEIEKERGVVLEEWRLGRGAGMRIFDKQAPVLFHGSKYARRLPIGTPDIIKKAPPEALVRYYKDWYRPDLMAVIAVGDFQTDDIEKRITAEFSSLSMPANPPPRVPEPMPAHRETLISIETDPEMPQSSVTVYNKLPPRPRRSARDYRRMVAEQLYHAMFNARLDEVRRRPDAPFLFALSQTGAMVRGADVFLQIAGVKEEALPRGLEVLLEEARRVDQHGFQATELERSKKDVLRQYQQAVLQRDKNEARGFAAEMVRHFLEKESMPGIEAELALVEKLLPSYTLAELNSLARQWNGSRVVAVSGPATMKKPSGESLLAVARAVESRTLSPFEDAVAAVPLMTVPPPITAKAKVVSEKTIPEIGVVEWKLGNGARVVVKPTDFSNDQVRLTGFSPGGHSLVKDAEFDSALFASEVASEGGLGPLDAIQLRKALSGKIAYASAHINELEEVVSAGGSPADLETLLQLVHLTFVAPRRDEQAFGVWRARETEQVRNRRVSPEVTFFEDMQVLMSQNHRRRRPTTPEVLKNVDIDKALAIYRDRFAEAGDFTFVFVGNVQLDTLKPLVETYLGSLPTKGRKETWRDVNVRPPRGLHQKTVRKGQEPKSMVVVTYHGKERWSRDTENDMRMLGDALRIRLREVLREDMGGVYGVSVGGGISRRPRPEYGFRISFGCAPENVDKLKRAVFDEIKAIQDKGIGEDVIAKIKETRVRAHEVDLKSNAFWNGKLVNAYAFGDDPKLIPDISEAVAKVSSARVGAAARKYLNPKEHIIGVLEPEGAFLAPPPAPVPAATPTATAR